MSDIDDITAGLESLNIGTYEAAYEKIVSFIKEDLKHTIGAKEEEVTRVLAGPFTHGGLLILLQEPRLHHPWGDGVHEVIDDCDSLKVLNEGFNLISDGRLNLTNGISVLDMRPFLAEKYHSKLDKWQWERLYDLVYNAIVAKKPDVLLCMGKVAKEAITWQRDPWNAQCLPYDRIIFAHHPSHSVNHNKHNLQVHENLCTSIYKAYNALPCNGLSVPRQIAWFQELSSRSLTISNTDARPTSFTDTQWLEDCPEVIMKLCLSSRYPLPRKSIGPGDYYDLEKWQRKWVEDDELAEAASVERARELLIELFEVLNPCFQKKSWFIPVYEVKWESLEIVLDGFTSEIEQACYLLAGSEPMTDEDSESEDGLSLDGPTPIERARRMVLHVKHPRDSPP